MLIFLKKKLLVLRIGCPACEGRTFFFMLFLKNFYLISIFRCYF